MEVFELFQLFYPFLLMNLYVPGFLNIWLVKKSLEKLFVSFDSAVGHWGWQLRGAMTAVEGEDGGNLYETWQAQQKQCLAFIGAQLYCLSAGGRSIQIGVCNVILGSWVYFFLRGKDHAESVYTCMSIQTWNKVTCLLISHCPHQLSRILINWDYTNFHSGWIHLTYH